MNTSTAVVLALCLAATPGLAAPLVLHQDLRNAEAWAAQTPNPNRDKVLKKVLADSRLAAMMNPDAMPFDMKRMAYGGFKKLVSY